MVKAASRGCKRKSPITDVEVGRFYKICHDDLPRNSPFWLKSIQVVRVDNKKGHEVTVVFPSKLSLDNNLSYGFDMFFTMNIKLVPKVLVRQVVYPEPDNTDDLMAFWMVNSHLVPKIEPEEFSSGYLSSSAIGSEEERVDEIDDKNALALVVKEESVDEQDVADNNQRRKRFKYWTFASFANGEKVILKILKEKNAVVGKEIVRSALRKEAQKEIGNTGLLDHLLKDIPGRLTPDGTFRFQRRHNHQGELIYWLETTDLADIRKQHGIENPSWIPSSCWKESGCPPGCPCAKEAAKEVDTLKEELSKVKRELEETKKQLIEVRTAEVTRADGCSECNRWNGGYW